MNACSSRLEQDPRPCAGVSQVSVEALTTTMFVASSPSKVTVVSGVVVK